VNRVLILILFFGHAFSEAQVHLIPYRLGDNWGFADTSLSIVIPPKYEAVGEFHEGFAWVKLHVKYGYINTKGEVVVEAKYDEVRDFNSQRARVRCDSVWFYIDRQGIRSKRPSSFCEVDESQNFIHTRKVGGKINIIYWTRVDSFVYKWDTTAYLWDDLLENGKGLAAVRKKNSWGIVNGTGELVLDPIYDSIIPNPRWRSTNGYFLLIHNGKFGVINDAGVIVVPPKYFKIDPFRTRPYTKVWLDESFYGYIDTRGREYFVRHP
jgi:hypothetical protein